MKYEGAIKKRVDALTGLPSWNLKHRCPVGHTRWPYAECDDDGCVWWVNAPVYKNCSFLAAQICDHTLAEIGDMMEISRERVRQIEYVAIKKLQANFSLREIHDTLHQQGMDKRQSQNSSEDPEYIRKDEADLLCSVCSGDLGFPDG